jgi:hypothetical protein
MIVKTVRAVLWSFLGIRSQQKFEQDKTQLSPITVIAVGFALCVVFVIALMILVNLIV